jgi:L-aspartate oxidase
MSQRWVALGEHLPGPSMQALRELLWQAAGPVREAASLRDASRICAAIAPQRKTAAG